MAPPINLESERGSALFEALAASVFMVYLSGVLLSGLYLFWTHAWLNYQSDQALFCVGAGGMRFQCERVLKRKSQDFLPWGNFTFIELSGFSDQAELKMEWQWGEWKKQYRKNLRIKDIIKRRDLSW
jgi:hypothetical protein